MARGETIAGLDIGTTKTCAVIATSGADGLEIIGVGEAPSTGMRKGVVTDLEETVRAIEAATEKAERMAGVHVSHVYVGVTGEHMQSTNNRGVVAVTPRRYRYEFRLAGGIALRVREDLDVEHVARIVAALASRARGC